MHSVWLDEMKNMDVDCTWFQSQGPGRATNELKYSNLHICFDLCFVYHIGGGKLRSFFICKVLFGSIGLESVLEKMQLFY